MSNYINYGKFSPPPPPVYPAASAKFQNAQIQSMKSPTPSNPYLSGIPVQFITIPENSNRPINTEPIIRIDFSKTPFTYLNFSNITTEPSEFFTVYISNVPLGAVFNVNGPISWEGASGLLVLTDTDSVGAPLPNASLTIPSRGTIEIPSLYVSILVVRDSTGFVAKAAT